MILFGSLQRPRRPAALRSFAGRIGWLLFFVTGMVVLQSPAADGPITTADQHIERVSREAKSFVETCELSNTDAKPVVFHRHPEPVLRWSNPTAGEVYGDIYLYTHHGRPVSMVSYYRWIHPNWGSTVEVHSLYHDRMVGTADGVRFWTPKDTGLKYSPLERAERPASAAAARLVQMRRIADEFSVQLEDTRGDQLGVKRSLRRLTQPLFRFPSPSADANYLDGALFAFVEGTDPELLLFVDAVAEKDGPTWRFAIARMNTDHILVFRQEQVVWEAPHLLNPHERSDEIYTTFSANTRLKAAP